MRITSRKTVVGGLTLATASALLLAGCAAAPDASSSRSAAASDFVPCMVSDKGGFDDKSFNQLGFEGITKAADELGVKPITVESTVETDYAPNIQSLLDQNCSLIVTDVGCRPDCRTAKRSNCVPRRPAGRSRFTRSDW